MKDKFLDGFMLPNLGGGEVKGNRERKRLPKWEPCSVTLLSSEQPHPSEDCMNLHVSTWNHLSLP